MMTRLLAVLALLGLSGALGAAQTAADFLLPNGEPIVGTHDVEVYAGVIDGRLAGR